MTGNGGGSTGGSNAPGTQASGDYAGLHVIDVTQGIAGPYCAMLFAQHGADVIKIEPLDGDWARGLGTRRGDQTVTHASANRGKRSLALDLRKPQARSIVHRLAAGAHLFLESSRPGVAARLGIDHAAISAVRPSIVYASFSGYGQKGPYAHLPMTDTVAQAFSGLMALHSEPDGTPRKLNHYFVDLMGSLYGFQAIAPALFAQAMRGKGRYLDISLVQAAAAIQAAKFAEHAVDGGTPAQLNAPAGIYRTRDGWLALTFMREDQFPRLCTMLAMPELAEDPRFIDFAARARHTETLKPLLSARLALRPTDEWLALLRAADLMGSAVLDYAQMLDDEHLRFIRTFAFLEQGGLGVVPVPTLPGTQPPAADDSRAQVPSIGQHSLAVLRDAGYGEEQIGRWVAEGLVGARR